MSYTLEDIRNVLIKSVNKRLMKDQDVKLGVLLSGGLDSSLISGITINLLREKLGKDVQLHSFSVGLPGSSDLM